MIDMKPEILLDYVKENLKYEVKGVISELSGYNSGVMPDYFNNLFYLSNEGEGSFNFILSGVHSWEVDNPFLITKYLFFNKNIKTPFIFYPHLHPRFFINDYDEIETNDCRNPPLATKTLMDFFESKSAEFKFDYFIDFHEHEADYPLIYSSSEAVRSKLNDEFIIYEDDYAGGLSNYFNNKGVNSLLVEVPKNKLIAEKYFIVSKILDKFL